MTLLLIVLALSGLGQEKFYAYHTKLSHTSTDYFGKYADLIVVLPEGQLEFTRQTYYQPRWVTAEGTYLVDDFYPDRDPDHNLYYSYVRLMEQNDKRIVVHWRYFPDIQRIDALNEELEPANIYGFQAAVHELYVIHRDGSIEREVRDARGSRWETWNRQDYGHRQILGLKLNGIEYGTVKWGNRHDSLPQSATPNPIIEPASHPEPIIAWTFDEGLGDVYEEFDDWEEWELAYQTMETVSEEMCEISGHTALYKPGVSGTALGFDGFYSGVFFEEEVELGNVFTVEAWIALDVYPYNETAIVHSSGEFGAAGFYLGVDAYGKLLLRINGKSIKSAKTLPLYTWTHVSASVKKGNASLYLDGEPVGSFKYRGNLHLDEFGWIIGLNNELNRPTDYVRGHDQNIPFIHGLQGMIDEVRVYPETLSPDQVLHNYQAFLPVDRTSPLKPGLLPGEVGYSDQFAASYVNLEFHDLWDRMWRLVEGTDIVVKFKDLPTSVVYWRGTNFAANWVTEKNHWMADQSSEIFTQHGCSEHMSDKQCRHSYARIIENNPARVKVHWRYPCVDVGYVCVDRMNFTDEYHTIYPDGTGIRHVIFNNPTMEPPGFQDIQYFTNPGETALDVVELNAVTVANRDGEVEEMVWVQPNRNPQPKMEDPSIQYINTKSDWKVYAIYPEPGLGTWGRHEQSKYTDDPFAGPWNHWPISVVPSDGRFAIAHDRVTHFALGAGDAGDEHVVHFGFTEQDIKTLIPRARSFQTPAEISSIKGAASSGFSRAEKAYMLVYGGKGKVSIKLGSSEDSPLVNPAFVVQDLALIPEKIMVDGRSHEAYHSGQSYDTQGELQTIVWLELKSAKPVEIEFRF